MSQKAVLVIDSPLHLTHFLIVGAGAAGLMAAPELARSGKKGSGACERAMTRDGTVGRSDATEPNLALHRDIDPVRMMRTRFADPIRASSPPGLHQQAGHMTASALC